MLGGWLGKIAQGRYETDIVSLRMTDGHGGHFEGQGFLTWTRKDGLRIEALTDGGAYLQSRLGQLPCPPGHLYPAAYYLKLEGKTVGQQSLCVERILPHDYHIYFGQPSVTWRISQRSIYSAISIRDDITHDQESPSVEFLASLGGFRWPRGSETTYDNPHFGSTSSRLDWFEFQSSVGSVAAQRLDARLARVRVADVRGEAAAAEIAIGLALSFVGGRIVSLLARESKHENVVEQFIHLPTRTKRRSTFPSPLGNDPRLDHHCEPLLSKAVAFFSTDDGIEAGSLMCMCLDSVDASFTTHALVVCVVLESLIKLLAPHVQQTQTVCEGQKKAILATLRQLCVGEGVVNRFSGFIGKMDELSPKNLLRVWAHKNVLGITMDDVHAWDRLRNRVAHGKRLLTGTDYATKQRDVTALDRIKNLVNKLLLNAMKYEGGFVAFGELEPKPFTAVDLSTI